MGKTIDIPLPDGTRLELRIDRRDVASGVKRAVDRLVQSGRRMLAQRPVSQATAARKARGGHGGGTLERTGELLSNITVALAGTAVVISRLGKYYYQRRRYRVLAKRRHLKAIARDAAQRTLRRWRRK